MEGLHLVEGINKKIEEIEREGCEQGRMTRYMVDNYRKDLNGLGKKMERINWLLLGSLFTLTINLIITFIKK